MCNNKNSKHYEHSNLSWSPLYPFLEDEILKKDNLILIISPFIKLQPLKRILSSVKYSRGLKIIVRWAEEDIIYGSTDIEIYPFLKEKGLQLYINRKIHLKLFVLDSNYVFHTSGNITSRGLGYSDDRNVEVGCIINLNRGDWEKIFSIINSSILVNDEIYDLFDKYREDKINVFDAVEPILIPENAWKKDFSIQSLPATDTPQILYEYYACENKDIMQKEISRRVIHDLLLYDVAQGFSEHEFFKKLKEKFRKHPFINSIKKFIKEKKSIRFGGVNSWIQEKCSDVPVPYKWEIKENTRILYNWLAYFYDEIKWNVPGKRSQVISWNEDE